MDTSTKKISGVVSKKGQEASKYPMSQSNETEETDHNQNFELSAETKALRNHLVLIEILKNLSTKDLLNYRLLNLEWSKLSTEVLLKRNAFHVNFLQRKNSTGFVLLRNKKLELQELTTLLTTSNRFPCSSFGFDGDLKLPDSKMFFKLHGKIIKEMNLEGHFDYNAALMLLSAKVPNLETLILDNYGFEGNHLIWESGNLPVQFDKHLPFSSLKSIVIAGFTYNKAMLREIIKTSPNLSSCTGHWDFDMAQILLNKMDVLKEFKFIPYHVMSDLKEFVKRISNLSKLHIDFHNLLDRTDANLYKLESPISRMLTTNQSTLKEIKFVMLDWLPFTIHWPRLENLWKLQIHVNCTTRLARGSFYQLSKKCFPNLHTLILKDVTGSEEWYPVPLKGSAPSVKFLDVRGPFEISVEILEMFPQLEHLRITKMPNFPVTGKIIWQMTSLKQLELGMLTDTVNTVMEVEKTFSGFDEETIRFFHKLGLQTKIEKSVLERRRINPSILDLTNLKELCISNGFSHYSEGLDCEYLNHPINKGLSYVLKRWTLDLIPHLHIVKILSELK